MELSMWVLVACLSDAKGFSCTTIPMWSFQACQTAAMRWDIKSENKYDRARCVNTENGEVLYASEMDNTKVLEVLEDK